MRQSEGPCRACLPSTQQHSGILTWAWARPWAWVGRSELQVHHARRHWLAAAHAWHRSEGSRHPERLSPTHSTSPLPQPSKRTGMAALQGRGLDIRSLCARLWHLPSTISPCHPSIRQQTSRVSQNLWAVKSPFQGHLLRIPPERFTYLTARQEGLSWRLALGPSFPPNQLRT